MKLVYFSWVKDRIGFGEEDIDLPGHVNTVADLLAWLPGRGANFADALADPAIIRVAVDQVYGVLSDGPSGPEDRYAAGHVTG